MISSITSIFISVFTKVCIIFLPSISNARSPGIHFSEIRNADRYILFHRSATPFLNIFRTFFRSIYKRYHTMNQICTQARTRNVLLTGFSRQKKRYPHLRISLFQPLTAVSFIFIEISLTISHAAVPEPVHGSARYHHTEPTAAPSFHLLPYDS